MATDVLKGKTLFIEVWVGPALRRFAVYEFESLKTIVTRCGLESGEFKVVEAADMDFDVTRSAPVTLPEDAPL